MIQAVKRRLKLEGFRACNRPVAGKRAGRGGFTLLELLVVIAIISVLAGLLLPVLSRAKAAAQVARCQGNLRQITLGLRMYVDDFGHYPLMLWRQEAQGTHQGLWWFDLLQPFTASSWTNGLYRCPAYRGLTFSTVVSGPETPLGWTAQGSYGYNTSGTGRETPGQLLGLGASGIHPPISESSVLVPSDMIALGDSGTTLPTLHPDRPTPSRFAHRHAANISFCDGHVELIQTNSLLRAAASERRRWNRDNQPHPETWPAWLSGE
jgi:prepilin-type N-terminal cleavage/methylation domain-containing protein/prepilin-type processing-associated H-X9-DG protein